MATASYTVKSINVENIGVEPISDGLDHKGGIVLARKENVFLESFKQHGSRTLSQVIGKYKNSSFPVSCVVYDSFLPWGLDVAKQHGILGASFFTNSATVCAIIGGVHEGILTLPLKIEEKPLMLPGLPPLRSRDIPSFTKEPETNPAYLAMILNQFSNLDMADWIFCNTFEELEGEVAKGTSTIWPAKLIGPTVPSAYLDRRIEGDKGYGASLWKPLSEECTNWLKTKPWKSVVYISFGSMVSLAAKQVEEMALALKGSDLSFLWAVRETERNKLPQGFEETSKGKKQGLVVPWCNQLETLAHPAIGCFVTHCGWNSTLEGLSLGVPMVGMPQWSDQMTNAKLIEEIWDVGVRAKEDGFGIVPKEELLFCLKEVMKGEKSQKIRRNATQWKALAREAVGEGGSSDKNTNEFVKHLWEGKLSTAQN